MASSHLGFHVHAGFLEALTAQAKIYPSHIGAASSGAFVGGLYAAGFSPAKIHEILTSPAMKRSFWEWRGPLRGFCMLANLVGFTGFLSGHKVATYLRSFLGKTRIEDPLRVELSLAVTNLTKGCSEIIRHGDLVDYIVASCAVPALFKGYEIDGNVYWDGAVADSAPFHQFLEDSTVDKILVHVITHRDRHATHQGLPTIARAFGQAHQIVTNRLLSLGVECAQLRGKKILVLTSEVPRYGFAEKGASTPLFEAGQQTILHHLPTLCEFANS